MTGFNALRDLEIGATLIAGGWALNRWASRLPTPATESLSDEPLLTSGNDDDESS
jgi:hypothetical protein